MQYVTGLLRVCGGLSFGLIIIPVFVIVPSALIILGISQLIKQLVLAAPVASYISLNELIAAIVIPSVLLLVGFLRR